MFYAAAMPGIDSPGRSSILSPMLNRAAIFVWYYFPQNHLTERGARAV